MVVSVRVPYAGAGRRVVPWFSLSDAPKLSSPGSTLLAPPDRSGYRSVAFAARNDLDVPRIQFYAWLVDKHQLSDDDR